MNKSSTSSCLQFWFNIIFVVLIFFLTCIKKQRDCEIRGGICQCYNEPLSQPSKLFESRSNSLELRWILNSSTWIEVFYLDQFGENIKELGVTSLVALLELPNPLSTMYSRNSHWWIILQSVKFHNLNNRGRQVAQEDRCRAFLAIRYPHLAPANGPFCKFQIIFHSLSILRTVSNKLIYVGCTHYITLSPPSDAGSAD